MNNRITVLFFTILRIVIGWHFLFVQGNTADKYVFDNKIDALRIPIEFIQKQGLIAGTAAHSIMVPKTCVENGIRPDFYMKTYHHNKYWSATPIDPENPYLPVPGNDHRVIMQLCINNKEIQNHGK
jgi:hypothetical protein